MAEKTPVTPQIIKRINLKESLVDECLQQWDVFILDIYDNGDTRITKYVEYRI